jgi:hypothetical protein
LVGGCGSNGAHTHENTRTVVVLLATSSLSFHFSGIFLSRRIAFLEPSPSPLNYPIPTQPQASQTWLLVLFPRNPRPFAYTISYSSPLRSVLLRQNLREYRRSARLVNVTRFPIQLSTSTRENIQRGVAEEPHESILATTTFFPVHMHETFDPWVDNKAK